MTDRFNILASDLGDILEVVVILAFVAISAIGGAVQRSIKKRQEQQAEQARRQFSRPPSPPPLPQQQQMPRPQQSVYAHPDSQSLDQAVQRHEDRQVGRQGPRMAGRQETRRFEDLPTRSDAMQKPKLRRKAPPPVAIEPPEPPVPHLEHLPPVKAVKPAEPAPARDLILDLASVEKLRMAILYREILSPPRALREEPELWEM